MKKVKIGIIREGKVPIDRRTPLTPKNCIELMERYPDLEIVIQPSKIRIILDEEYKALKIPLQEDLSDCDYIFGIKEIPVSELIEGKTYFFFSHTIKKQPANQKLLQTIVEKKCTLVDYECIKDQEGNRLISFGHFAGIVGAYNTLKTYGHRYRLFDLKSAHLCYDYAEMKTYFKKVKLKPVKIAVTGGGRVAKGAIEALKLMKIREVTPGEFLKLDFDSPVFSVIHSEDFYFHKDRKDFDRKEFYTNPKAYESGFLEFAKRADILIASAYWNPAAPLLFTKNQMRASEFKIKVIGDITCDIKGSIPSTLRSTSIDNPVYDYNPFTEDLEVPYSSDRNVTVMAIDNLPCELSRDASEDFGNQLIKNVFPQLLADNSKKLINGTIVRDGKLTEKFLYLKDYVRGHK